MFSAIDKQLSWFFGEKKNSRSLLRETNTVEVSDPQSDISKDPVTSRIKDGHEAGPIQQDDPKKSRGESCPGVTLSPDSHLSSAAVEVDKVMSGPGGSNPAHRGKDSQPPMVGDDRVGRTKRADHSGDRMRTPQKPQ